MGNFFCCMTYVTFCISCNLLRDMLPLIWLIANNVSSLSVIVTVTETCCAQLINCSFMSEYQLKHVTVLCFSLHVYTRPALLQHSVSSRWIGCVYWADPFHGQMLWEVTESWFLCFHYIYFGCVVYFGLFVCVITKCFAAEIPAMTLLIRIQEIIFTWAVCIGDVYCVSVTQSVHVEGAL